MNAGRTTKQGQQINIGKDSAEYQATVSTVHAAVVFTCVEGKVPIGMIFVPYGPPTCRLMGRDTDGTGMPTSKGWEVQVEPIAGGTAAAQVGATPPAPPS